MTSPHSAKQDSRAAFGSRAGGAALVVGALAIASVALAWYVARTYTDVVFLDGLQLLPSVDDLLSGHHRWSALFLPYGEHRIPLYRALLTLNALLLGLNMRLDPAVSAVTTVVTAAVLALWVRSTTVGPGTGRSVSLATLPVIAFSVSLAAPPMLFMAVQFQIGTLLVLAIGALVCRWEGPHQHGRRALVATAIGAYFLFCSGAYFPGLIASLAGVLATRWFLERRSPSSAEWGALALAIACAGLYAITTAGADAKAPPLVTKLERATAHPTETLKFLLGGFAASLVDVHSFLERVEPACGSGATLAVGAVMALFTTLGVAIFCRSRMWKRTYLPVWLLAYVAGVMLAVRVGRAGGGWQWMMNEWYSFHLKFIPIAVYWILLFGVLERVKSGPHVLRSIEGMTFLAFMTFASTTWVFTNRDQIQRSDYVRSRYEDRRDALLDPDGAGRPFEEVLLVSRDEAERGVAILRGRHLNVFRRRNDKREQRDAVCSRPAFRRVGLWYEDGWIGNSAALVPRCCPRRRYEIDGRVPGKILGEVYGGSIRVDLMQDGEISGSVDVHRGGNGRFVLTGSIAPRAGQIEIVPSKTFIPRDHPGQPDDGRELSVIVDDARCR